jgi:hypothetical protein
MLEDRTAPRAPAPVDYLPATLFPACTTRPSRNRSSGDFFGTTSVGSPFGSGIAFKLSSVQNQTIETI